MGHSQEILVVLVILCGVMGTMIKLNNGGFEDIVIAINPNIREDKRIIGNIKSMVKEASRYLFSATKQRFYFKSVKVIVPFTWIPRKEYKKPTIETYENADVIIAGSNLKYGDDPYTLQYGTCGVPGQYIHFTPNFLTDDNLIAVYGPRGRVFVHEWAHLRWGVFDEYNRDALFYTDGKKKVEATRCSADISGRYVFPTRRRKFRKCWFQKKTQLYNPGCQFVPDKNQNISSSIMYLQSLPFVTQFCDKSNHNIKATNMQNKICNCRSTWEVIMNSPDFVGSSPITSPPPDPTISVMQTQDRVLGLVLDVSETMNEHNRINRLKQAATLFLLQYIETGSWVGITTFQSSAQIKVYLQQIVNDKVRQGLSKFLPTIASGESDICAGISEGIKMLKGVTGYEIVLLTSGSNIAISSCLTDIKNSGSIIHIISLGSSVANELDTLAIMTGGFKFTCSDSLNSNDLIDAFTGISSRSRDITQQTIQLESESEHVDGYRSLEGIVSIDYTVGMNTFFVVTWSENNSPPQIILKDPKGHKYYHGDFVVDTNIKLARLKINGLAKLGDWTYMLHNAYPKAQTLSIIVTSQPASATVPPLNVKPYSSTDNSVFPSPVIIYAELSQGFLPLVGANVIAIIKSSSGTEEIELWDNGSGADVIKHDGIYSRYFTSFKENGKYSIKVCAHRKDKTARQVLRENLALYLPGYIANGTIHMNPPKPTVDKTRLTGGIFNFNRTVVASSVVVTGVPPGGYQDIYPPCRITDLEVLFNLNDEFSLSWTAPGDDYDNGTAESYEMKISENPLDLQDANFHSALSVNLSDLKPEVAGVKQDFQYKTKNFTKENGTEVFFAIRAIDDSKNVGQVSNIAKAVVLVPSLSKASIVAIICGILMITCILISIAFCSLHNLSSGTPEAQNTIAL